MAANSVFRDHFLDGETKLVVENDFAGCDTLQPNFLQKATLQEVHLRFHLCQRGWAFTFAQFMNLQSVILLETEEDPNFYAVFLARLYHPRSPFPHHLRILKVNGIPKWHDQHWKGLPDTLETLHVGAIDSPTYLPPNLTQLSLPHIMSLAVKLPSSLVSVNVPSAVVRSKLANVEELVAYKLALGGRKTVIATMYLSDPQGYSSSFFAEFHHLTHLQLRGLPSLDQISGFLSLTNLSFSCGDLESLDPRLSSHLTSLQLLLILPTVTSKLDETCVSNWASPGSKCTLIDEWLILLNQRALVVGLVHPR